ncbi:hypothetical protein DFJ77DRAFT_439870 [Powellomyces hirtus]|nr:hypothetical protein DFJ77DRAFT_439870 [Powellomyces hirtus]
MSAMLGWSAIEMHLTIVFQVHAATLELPGYEHDCAVQRLCSMWESCLYAASTCKACTATVKWLTKWRSEIWTRIAKRLEIKEKSLLIANEKLGDVHPIEKHDEHISQTGEDGTKDR